MKTVTIYTTPTCHFCHLAKDYFTEHNIAFTEHNVATDMEKRQEMVEITGQMGVPVIVISQEGKDPVGMVGFNQQLFSDTFFEGNDLQNAA
jgi:glutaredoxin 3